MSPVGISHRIRIQVRGNPTTIDGPVPESHESRKKGAGGGDDND